MSELCINISSLNNNPEHLRNSLSLLKKEISELTSVKESISIGGSTNSIKKSIEKVEDELIQQSDSLKILAEQMEEIINTYKKAEEKILANNVEKKDTSTNQDKSGKEADSKTDDDSFIENAIQQALGGAFYEGDTNWLGSILALIISFVPGLNCIADIRDLAADIMTVMGDGTLTLKEAGLLALDIGSLAGDVISVGALVKGIKGATKTTKIAKTAAKQSAKSTKTAAKEASKAAAKAQKEAAEKGTRKTTRKALKTTKAAEKAQKESKAAKEAAKQASKEHSKAVAKETKQAVEKGTEKNIKKKIDGYKENPQGKVTEDQIKKQYKSETRAESKAANEAKKNSEK